MKRQTLYVLAGVFAALVALIAISRWSMSQPSLGAKPPLDFSTLTESSADRVQISGPGGGVQLLKQGGKWVVFEKAPTNIPSPPASKDKITALFRTLSGASFDRLVTREATDPGSFGLTTASAVNVTIAGNGRTVAAFSLGNETDVPGTNYFQAAKSKEIWAVSGGLKDVLSTSRDQWKASEATPAAAPPARTAPAPGSLTSTTTRP